MNIDKLKHHIEWEEYYNPKFNWDSPLFYKINRETLSEEFIEEFKDKLNWDKFCTFNNLSESFIEKYANKVDWGAVSMWSKLSEAFIEKHKKRLNFSLMCVGQTLSESFIEKYANKESDWGYISEYQVLSEDFIRKHIKEISYCSLLLNKKIRLSEQFIEDFFPQIIRHADWKWFFKVYKLSKEFQKKLKIQFKDYLH